MKITGEKKLPENEYALITIDVQRLPSSAICGVFVLFTSKLYSMLALLPCTGNDTVFVSNVYEVPADVGPSTGDIDYDGSVEVKGNVLSGYTVHGPLLPCTSIASCAITSLCIIASDIIFPPLVKDTSKCADIAEAP